MTREDYDAINALNQSQIKTFATCPLAWYAENVAKVWERETTKAMLAGCLFEAVLTDDKEAECALFQSGKLTKKPKANQPPELYAEFTGIIDMVNAWNRHPALVELLDGEYQVGLVGFIGGVACKGLADCVDHDRRRIIDFKSAAGFASSWSEDYGCRVPWWKAWRYHWQAWFYVELARQMWGERYEYIIAAASKQTPPRFQALRIGPLTLSEPAQEMPRLIEQMARFKKDIAGLTGDEKRAKEAELLACRRDTCTPCGLFLPVTLEDVL